VCSGGSERGDSSKPCTIYTSHLHLSAKEERCHPRRHKPKSKSIFTKVLGATAIGTATPTMKESFRRATGMMRNYIGVAQESQRNDTQEWRGTGEDEHEPEHATSSSISSIKS